MKLGDKVVFRSADEISEAEYYEAGLEVGVLPESPVTVKAMFTDKIGEGTNRRDITWVDVEDDMYSYPITFFR